MTCNHCAKRLAFFNKCSLLLHAREHKERGMIMQCSHLVMKPVPMEQMISKLETTAAGQRSVFFFMHSLMHVMDVSSLFYLIMFLQSISHNRAVFILFRAGRP